MARYIGPTCKLARREGADLSLKSPARALDSKCKLEQKPGQHGAAKKGKMSDYAVQLREKQKVKRLYGIGEAMFSSYVHRALSTKGVTGTIVLQTLERRLDNIVYRLGFSASRRQARQLIRHGHVLVDGKQVDVPGYLVNAGQVVEVAEATRNVVGVQAALAATQTRLVPEWLLLDRASVKGTVSALPTREQMPQSINEQVIVELYSRF